MRRVPSPRRSLLLLLGALVVFAGAFAVGRAGRPQAAHGAAAAAIEALPAPSGTPAVPRLVAVAELPALHMRQRVRKRHTTATPGASSTTGSTLAAAPATSTSTAAKAPPATPTKSATTKTTTRQKSTTTDTGGDVSSGGNSLGGG
jgi:hypothetical protein